MELTFGLKLASKKFDLGTKLGELVFCAIFGSHVKSHIGLMETPPCDY